MSRYSPAMYIEEMNNIKYYSMTINIGVLPFFSFKKRGTGRNCLFTNL